jgi:hypothetical protein
VAKDDFVPGVAPGSARMRLRSRGLHGA